MDGTAYRVEISDEVEGVEGNRRRARWMWWGFGIGLIVGLIATAVHVAIVGYHILPIQPLSNLVIFPYVGLLIGLNRYRARYVGTWRWKRPQIRTGTLMLVVAYFALLFGLGVWTDKLGSMARQHYQKYYASRSMVEIYGKLGQKSLAEVELRRRNLEQFREGKIPDGLLPIQKDFLRNLEKDPKAAPEYRKYRRKLIEDGERFQLSPQESNVVVFRKLVDYHDKLKRKYDQARWHPWLPVEPDPPPP